MNAIILAGGKGSRLAPWHAPKCLLPVNGVPILNRILDHLFGWTGGDYPNVVDKAIICTGYRADDVEAAIDSWGWLEEHVRVSFAGEDAPMGERLLKARELTDGGRCLILYGDELADVDLRQLFHYHEQATKIGIGRMLTFTVAKQVVPGGVIPLQPPLHIVDNFSVWVNIGFVIVDPACWGCLKPEDGLSDWINKITDVMIGMHTHEGRRATINTLADLKTAEEMWK